MKIIHKKYHALIKICKKVLDLPDNHIVTSDDVETLRTLFNKHLHEEHLSPAKIKELYSIEYTDFGMFIKTSLKLELKSHKDSVKSACIRLGRAITDEKRIYQNLCAFNFGIWDYPTIDGYSKLQELGVYHPTDNQGGVSRDHMLSVEEGWRTNIDPSLISHPANCRILEQNINSSKGSGSSITIDELKLRISSWDAGLAISYDEINKNVRSLPKSEEHKRKISETNKQYMTITNGTKNLRIKKTEEIPHGFWRGMTRYKTK